MKNSFNPLIKFFLENSIIIFQLNIALLRPREATIIIKKIQLLLNYTDSMILILFLL